MKILYCQYGCNRYSFHILSTLQELFILARCTYHCLFFDLEPHFSDEQIPRCLRTDLQKLWVRCLNRHRVQDNIQAKKVKKASSVIVVPAQKQPNSFDNFGRNSLPLTVVDYPERRKLQRIVSPL